MARDPSRTEQATPKRLNKARQEGNVMKSQEVAKAVTLLAGYIVLLLSLGQVGTVIQRLFRHFLQLNPRFEPSPANIYNMFIWLTGEMAKMVLPIMFFVAAAAFVALRAQVGKLWTTKVFEFKWSRFNPVSGLKRMLISPQTLIRMFKSLAQAFFIGIAPWLVLRDQKDVFMALYHQDAASVAVYILTTAGKVVSYALFPMLIIAAADWFYTRWDYGENLKMTKEEVKDERKQQEGDPKVKQAMRQKMMQMSMRRMMQEVPKADVIITNPTHISVALRYDTELAPAPMVVAKGADHVAFKIREIAKEHNIPLRENKPLARALYKQVEVGDAIPPEMFQAVAVILAQIWKTSPKKQKEVKKS